MFIYGNFQAHLYEGEQYRGSKSFEHLEEFILSNLRVQVTHITLENWEEDQFSKQQWILFLCAEGDDSCPETNTQLKLAAAMVIYYFCIYNSTLLLFHRKV